MKKDRCDYKKTAIENRTGMKTNEQRATKLNWVTENIYKFIYNIEEQRDWRVRRETRNSTFSFTYSDIRSIFKEMLYNKYTIRDLK